MSATGTGGAGGKPRTAAVDDDPDVRDPLCAVLPVLGHQVIDGDTDATGACP